MSIDPIVSVIESTALGSQPSMAATLALIEVLNSANTGSNSEEEDSSVSIIDVLENNIKAGSYDSSGSTASYDLEYINPFDILLDDEDTEEYAQGVLSTVQQNPDMQNLLSSSKLLELGNYLAEASSAVELNLSSSGDNLALEYARSSVESINVIHPLEYPPETFSNSIGVPSNSYLNVSFSVDNVGLNSFAEVPGLRMSFNMFSSVGVNQLVA